MSGRGPAGSGLYTAVGCATICFFVRTKSVLRPNSIHRSAWNVDRPKLTRTLLRRSGSPTEELAGPPVASSETRDPTTLALARSVSQIGAACSTPLRTLQSPGCPQESVWLARLWRVLLPSRKYGSWGCTSTSVCPPFRKGRCLRCTRCYDPQNARRGSDDPLSAPIHPSAWKVDSAKFAQLRTASARVGRIIVGCRMRTYR